MLIKRNRNFRNLYFGQLFSVFGDWIKTISLIGFVFYLTGSANATGILFLLAIIPQITVSFFSGPFIDKFNKKKLIIYLDLIRFTLGIVLVFSVYLEQLLLTLGIVFVTNVFSSIFIPTRSAFISQIIEKDDIVAANNILLVSFNVTMAISTAIGGIILSFLGTHSILMLSAFMYLISAMFVLFIKYTPSTEQVFEQISYLKQLKEGYFLVKESNLLKSTFLMNSTRDFATGAINIMFNTIILTHFLMGDTGIAYGYTATAIGFLVLGLIAKKFIKTSVLQNQNNLANFSLLMVTLYGLLLAVTFSLNNFWLFLLFILLMNIPQGLLNISFESSVMHNATDTHKGRVFAFLMTSTRLGYAFGLLMYMALSQVLSVTNYGWLLCLLLVLTGLINKRIHTTNVGEKTLGSSNEVYSREG